MRMNRYFSLLEIMVGLSIILMAAGAIGWKMQGFLEERRFKADLEQLKSRILTTRRIAVNMQADWEGTLKPNGKSWTFEAFCVDSSTSRSFSPIKAHISEIFFNGKKQGFFSFRFFSSGEIWPSGTLMFRSSKDRKTETWNLPAMLGKSEGVPGGELGPVHPNEA